MHSPPYVAQFRILESFVAYISSIHTLVRGEYSIISFLDHNRIPALLVWCGWGSLYLTNVLKSLEQSIKVSKSLFQLNQFIEIAKSKTKV